MIAREFGVAEFALQFFEFVKQPLKAQSFYNFRLHAFQHGIEFIYIFFGTALEIFVQFGTQLFQPAKKRIGCVAEFVGVFAEEVLIADLGLNFIPKGFQ